jgi:hypothetical protein
MRKALRSGLFVSLLLALAFPLASCDSAGSGGSGGSISFPSEGEFGPNLLSEEFSGEIKTVSASTDLSYSLAAKTPNDDGLTVAFLRPEGGNAWVYGGGVAEPGWQVETGDKVIEYYLPEGEKGIYGVGFQDPINPPDTTTLEIYKGSSTTDGSPDRTVKVTWGSDS